MASMAENTSLRGQPPEARRASESRARVRPILAAAGLTGPLLMLTGGLGLALTAVLWRAWHWEAYDPTVLVLLPAIIVAVAGVLVAGARLRRRLLRPLLNLERTVAQICQGEPGASLAMSDAGILGDLVRSIDCLNEELTGLYDDMDDRVARQTMRLAQKTASLKILYDVAAGINQVHDLDELLLRFLRVLKEMVNGRAATVRLETSDGKRRLVGSIGLNNDLVREREMWPLDLCPCGTALSPGDILCENNGRYCSRLYGRRMFGTDEIEVVMVPLEYQDQVLGTYKLFVQKPGVSGREDILELLATIGHHLGMAVAKQRSDQEARRLSILEERNALAHELHDSLAQTLASLRFQVRLLDDSLRQGKVPDTAHRDLERIRNGLDEAHTELRELLQSFRVPLDRRGFMPSLEQLTHRFGQETGLHVFFQNECRKVDLPAASEMQMLRIVQEALTNIRKHAQAHTVRILLTCRSRGALVLLVEDDGVGFDTPIISDRPGEHIGLSIMQERAQRIGAELRIESEPGEGTRVELTLEPQERAAAVTQALAS